MYTNVLPVVDKSNNQHNIW